jgi:hypothetical protein
MRLATSNDTLNRFGDALVNASSFGDVPGMTRLVGMIRQQGLLDNSDLCLQVVIERVSLTWLFLQQNLFLMQLCVSYARLNLADEFLQAVSQFIAVLLAIR